VGAILGLVGVVVGAGATFGATYWFELRRERREFKAAQVVMTSELDEASRAIKDAMKGHEWPAGWHNKNWTESWSRYRPVLASKMNGRDFQPLAGAYLEIELLQAGLAAGARELSEKDKVFLERAGAAVKAARSPPSAVAD
jgi:hypothetical protein